MRKISTSDIKWHIVHEKNLRSREKTHKVRLARWKANTQVQRKITHLELPENLDFDIAYDETVAFLDSIKQEALTKDDPVFLNFSKCKNISFEACVVLAAQIDRCLRVKPRCINGNYPKDPAVYVALHTLGFFDMLKIVKPVDLPTLDGFEITKLESGSTTTIVERKKLLALIAPINELVNSENKEAKLKNSIFRSLTEAMLNANEHAYTEELKLRTDCVPKWWRAGYYDTENMSLTMVFYDQGAGIPNTLGVKWYEQYLTLKNILGGKPLDSDVISLAMELDRTSSNKKGKGKGLKDTKSLLNYIGLGSIKFISCKGYYKYSMPQANINKMELSLPLEGTLITWNITLKDKFNDENNTNSDGL